MEMAGTPPLAEAEHRSESVGSGVESRKRPAAENSAALWGKLRCLDCAATGLVPSTTAAALTCQQCAAQYVTHRCGDVPIPWLFADPDKTRLQWKARYNGFLHGNSMDLERLRQARSVSKGRKLSRQRIDQLLQARERYRNQIVDLLAPLELERINWPADSTALLQSKLPKNQGLSSYTSNIFRDWAWDNGENDALLEAVARVMDADPRSDVGSVLTLGAGACRLPYDVHRRYEPRMSVALDMNPLLLQVASRVIQGETLPLYEFPIAPLNQSSYAVLQACAVPAAITDANFHVVLGDALNLPFAKESFDTIVTPWLIDIVPQDLRVFLPHINECLTDGGVWVNTGSLAFFHRDESWCYSEEEVVELLEESGFELLASERRTIPYLKSPHSAHGRTEDVFSFIARKLRAVDSPRRMPYLPDWVLDTSRPVPASNETAVRSSNHLLTAQILAAIDGKKTIARIGRMLARQYGLGTPETIHAVRQVLINVWEDAMSERADKEN